MQQQILTELLKPSQIQEHTGLTICNNLALPTLLYGRGTWAIREEDKSRIRSEEVKYTLQDYKNN
jgi:hypothetical protein